MITLWIVIQTIVDFLILLVILLYILERKNRQKEGQNIKLRKKETQELVQSLDRLITESERASIDISDKALLSQKKITELLDQLEVKQKELQEEEKKVALLLEEIKKNQLEADEGKKESVLSEEDKYSEAAKLAKNGLNSEEISRQLDLPKGEVELILDLPLRNTKKN